MRGSLRPGRYCGAEKLRDTNVQLFLKPCRYRAGIILSPRWFQKVYITVQFISMFSLSQAGATPGAGLQLRCACFGSAGSGHKTVVLTKYPRLLILVSKYG